MQAENEDFDIERYAADTFDPEILAEIEQIMQNKKDFDVFINDLNVKVAESKLQKINIENKTKDET